MVISINKKSEKKKNKKHSTLYIESSVLLLFDEVGLIESEFSALYRMQATDHEGNSIVAGRTRKLSSLQQNSL